jgi:hypothetical protein
VARDNAWRSQREGEQDTIEAIKITQEEVPQPPMEIAYAS